MRDAAVVSEIAATLRHTCVLLRLRMEPEAAGRVGWARACLDDIKDETTRERARVLVEAVRAVVATRV